ncbi:MAG: glycosyltransferase [Patescibacteria group bacterium]|nr:glycosyltransferase [Patescibacteria group bacterium]
MKGQKPLIGFIGQGFIGKNYADDFERRGYRVVRYSLEEPYIANKDKIRDCDIVFIAVPTPTTPKGFDFSIVRAGIELVGKDKTAVIKSTIVPGTARRLQKEYPDRTVIYSPEFLSEATAAHDAAHPFSNVVGLTDDSPRQREIAEEIHAVLPSAPFSLTCSSTEAEIIKYTHNGSGYTQVVFFNLMYDFASAHGCDWNLVQKAMEADPMISNRYARPVHKSGRGAGGHCFIKDVAALRAEYEQKLPDEHGIAVLKAMEEKNIDLLRSTGKDLDILEDVYGTDVLAGAAPSVEVPELSSVYSPVRLLIATEALDRADPLLGFFHRWVEEFARHASRVHVVCLGRGEGELPANVSEHSLGKPHKSTAGSHGTEAARGIHLIKRLRYGIRFIHYAWKYRHEYDDVLVHLNPEYLLIGGLLWRLLGKRVGFWYNDARASLRTRVAASLADVLFYSSPDSYVSQLPHARKIPMGVDVDMYDVAERKAGPDSMLFLGRITAEKRLDTTLAALGRIAKNNSRFSFDIYGASGSGDDKYLKELRKNSAELEKRGLVTFRGSVPHDKTPDVYAKHDIFVHIGSRRGFNKTLFEACGAGCIVVTADPILRWVVDERLFVPKSDEKSVSEAITAALALSPEERERERGKLIAYVRREHALSSVVPAMLEMLRRKGGQTGK